MLYPNHNSFDTLLSKVDACLENNRPFAIYRKPLSSTVHGVFQLNTQPHTALSFEERGFVFAPFDADEEALLITPDETLTASFTAARQPGKYKVPIASLGKAEHLSLVTKGIQAIKAGQLQKVVLSRSIEVPVATKPTTLFSTLLERYPTAFCYLLFHPKAGLWCGASPETLVHLKARALQTMALAATLPSTSHEPPRWSSKEQEEHALTLQDIRKRLAPLLESLHVEEAQSVRAGHLWHLRSTIEGRLRPGTQLKDIVTTLHPTPAVCGIPTQAAKAFIQQHENYPRTFYTGFLGELNLNGADEVSLFVNLRCMRLHGDTASLFVGGGITEASNPEKEWEETQDKSKTLLNVLYL